MDLEKLEKLAIGVLEELSSYNEKLTQLYFLLVPRAKVESLMAIAYETFPEHSAFFSSVSRNLISYRIYSAIEAIEYLLEILEMEKVSKAKIKEMKVFESADEKVKQASLSFRKEDYTSAFHNLNTALELVLKDKIEIPTTITGVNTSTIIDVLVKHKVECYLYLTEAKKRVLIIDNKIKHQAYSPTKLECLNAIKAMEELISCLRDKEIKLTEEIRNKIYQGL